MAIFVVASCILLFIIADITITHNNTKGLWVKIELSVFSLITCLAVIVVHIYKGE